MSPSRLRLLAALLLCTGLAHGPLRAQPALLQAAEAERPALLKTLEQLVAVESGSRETAGLGQIAELLAGRLKGLGAEIEWLEPREVYRMEDTPETLARHLKAQWRGKGSKKLLLIAHMDTVYPAGMLAQQPFGLREDRAYGLGIADDKQGLALVLHSLALLKAQGYAGCGQITVLFNADEEISSPGSRSWLTQLGAEHDAVMSFEGGGGSQDALRLATAGIASVNLTVHGRAAHAGSAPQNGVNALYELSHQILQMRDLSDAKTGVKLNWTMAKAGIVRNMVPPLASASADVRVLRVADYDELERKLQARIQNRLLPEARVELQFERRRPPLEASKAGQAFAEHARQRFAEIGRPLRVDAVASGGGTDAAFAALRARGPVVEGFGLRGGGAHTTDAEFIYLDSIAPRLYLATRMMMDFCDARVAAE
ncbi:glutamate carboxypeptidase [Paucibacter sediminis]|uniref:Glutamate carboxypeptidase n=1 Tax=Paucibacter sediminis TaxID=3019553 RepID=A0AA95SMS8_9BURK|nr:glutamate carboxypeptidase [Paucibacter sp. S2-9]WIT11752.1 glutamate carboxypeptidase [Paucibacter sp. S2-9]